MRDVPAFPTDVPQIGPTGYPTGETVTAEGLTKREYFAALAMQGLLAAHGRDATPDPDVLASWAVEYADALIKRLEETR